MSQVTSNPSAIPHPTSSQSEHGLRSLLAFFTPALVFSALAAVGYWGHHTNWQFVAGGSAASAVAPAETWCDEHGVSEEECIVCKPELMPVDAEVSWCKEHGVHVCPLCNPAVVQDREPRSLPGYRERVAEALALRPRAENAKSCQKHQPVQFGSTSAVDKAGVEARPVGTSPIVEAIGAVGEITYDQTKLARVAARVPGTVARVLVGIGDQVEEGDLLALVDAAEVGRGKADLLDALSKIDLGEQNVERLAPLADQQIIPGIRLLEARTELEQARISARRAQQALVNLGLDVSVNELRSLPPDRRTEELQFLGLPAEVRQNLPASATTSNLLPLLAPLTGVVIERSVVDGEVIDSSRHLFQIADTGAMWITFNVALEDAHLLRKGQKVQFQPDGRGAEVEAAVDWISTDVNEQTRTIAVRATVPNLEGKLRNETFGNGKIILRENPEAIVVPNSAIHGDGNCSVVFVRDKRYFDEKSPKFFHTRTVRLGATDGEVTEILAGVWPGERIAVEGSGVLKAQLLKSNLGAGCTCHH